MSFPTSILVAANVDYEGNIIEDPLKDGIFIQYLFRIALKIEIPTGISSLIIDGQHRLNAFSYTEEQGY
ncbi:MAG: hypothetical protein ACLSGF_02445 [Alistipes onderdonkii]